MSARPARLRQVDVKAEHFERQVTRLEQERDQWEKKYEVRNIILASSYGPPDPLCRHPLTRLLIPGSKREVSRVEAGARRARRQHGGSLIPQRSAMYHTPSFDTLDDDCHLHQLAMPFQMSYDHFHDFIPLTITLHANSLGHLLACV